MSALQNEDEVEGFEPTIVAFLCNWCSYAGADLAGSSRMSYPPNVEVIRVMCSGRINPMLVIHAFQEGTDGVLIGGCHPGECHYQDGNFLARRRMTILRKLLEYVGVEKERLKMAWISAGEGEKFVQVIRNVSEEVKKLGPMRKLKR